MKPLTRSKPLVSICIKRETILPSRLKDVFHHTNTLWPAIYHTSSRDSKSSVVVLADPKNQKIEHQTIRWEDLTFHEHLVINNPKPLMPKKITSADITENLSFAVISFPRISTIEHRRIDIACKQSRYYRDPSTVDTTCSSSSSCRHNPLYELA